MKTQQEVESFKIGASRAVYTCIECQGRFDTKCKCTQKFNFDCQAYEACLPRDFWRTMAKDVSHNTAAFNSYVKPYTKRINTALRRGYGLLLSGTNGVGKTMFMSYVLSCAIRRGRSAYYTTMLQLDHNIKQGFNDYEIQKRLEYMLTSDFLGIDEMGKEHIKDPKGSSFIKSQVERLLKQRFDESKPVIMASNLDIHSLQNTYGSTILSIINGKYQIVFMEPGDIRKHLADRMVGDMGYEG